jgi:predicted transcriptional regulator of viral defense system
MKAAAKKTPDHNALYHIAEQQAGYFTARQAAGAGFSWERLADYSKNGRFQRVAHGVYRLAQFPSSRFEDLFVAWLKCGPKSAISHESALVLYDLSDVLPGEIHVTVPRTASRRRIGIHLHTNRLSPTNVVKREGLRVTSVPRTIADVAKAGLYDHHIARAIREALERGLTTTQALNSEARRRGGRTARLINSYSNSSKGHS